MSKSASETSEEFEFIETPRAPTPVPPEENYGVRTTSVSTLERNA
jgi:sphingolipid C9-methyltransferase